MSAYYVFTQVAKDTAAPAAEFALAVPTPLPVEVQQA
jgi:hypothetical protein